MRTWTWVLVGLAAIVTGCSSATVATSDTGHGTVPVTGGTVAPVNARVVADLLMANTSKQEHAVPERSKATLPPTTLPLVSFSAFTLIDPTQNDQSRDVSVGVSVFDTTEAVAKRERSLLGLENGTKGSVNADVPEVAVITCENMLVDVRGLWRASKQTVDDYGDSYRATLEGNGYGPCQLVHGTG